jgi:predicted nucleic acid-binding Zn ribbon protein
MSRTLYTHACLACDRVFLSVRPDAQTCSGPCRQALYRLRVKRRRARRAQH